MSSFDPLTIQTRHSTAMSSLYDLPDEVLQIVVSYLPPIDVLRNFSRVSQRCAQLSSEPLLWRHHCRTIFKYWDAKHQIRAKLAANVAEVHWRALFVRRLRVDLLVAKNMDGIVATQHGRIARFEGISRFGYDAKDALLGLVGIDNAVEDVLARKYYSTLVLDHIHRGIALETWAAIMADEEVSLEAGLGAFDLFILHENRGDQQEISEMLDDLAIALRQEEPDMDLLTPRGQALAIAQFLRIHDLTGLPIDDGAAGMYRNLQNTYLGIALQDSNHPSLPLISVAIYCSLAQRFNLDAKPCNFPGHIHAHVLPAKGTDMDGKPSASSRPMYLDPWRRATEVPVDHLIRQLQAMGVREASDYPNFLGATTISSLILRTSRNILTTVHAFRDRPDNLEDDQPTINLYGNPYLDLDNAFYSSLWANFILHPNVRGNLDEFHFIPMLLERFDRLYPMDYKFVERYVLSAAVRPADDPNGMRRTFGEAAVNITSSLNEVRARDEAPVKKRRRDSQAEKEGVQYHVGQIFRHKRYGYIGVIIGWDVECEQNSEWIQHNRIDSLSNGRRQSFYHVLVDDSSVRYVAEENVGIVEDEDEPAGLMSLAGKYFKRWDRGAKRFVSNVKDEYPDD